MRTLKLTVEVIVEFPDGVNTDNVYLKLPSQVKLETFGYGLVNANVKKVSTVNWSVVDDSYSPYPHYY